MILRIINGPYRGAAFPIEREETRIGSSDQDQVILFDGQVHAQHAVIRLGTSGPVLFARQGPVQVNEVELEAPLPLQGGERLLIGSTGLVVMSQTQTGHPRLMGIVGPVAGKDYLLTGERARLGRSREDADVALPDPAASRVHTELFHQGALWMASDQGSANGTRINGQRIAEPHPLRAGDELRLGSSAFLFCDGRIDDRCGQIVAGCILDHRWGSGSMGVVYRAHRGTDGSPVAIKFIHPDLTADAAGMARILNGIRAAQRFEHPNLVPILDHGRHEDLAYIISPWSGNGSVIDLLALGAEVPPLVVSAILADVARGLHAAYASGLPPRELHPGDLLIESSGLTRIADFGLVLPWQPTTPGAGPSPFYLAPEVVQGSNLTPLANQFSLGAIGFHLLTGQPPFTGKGPAELAQRRLNHPLPTIPSSVPGLLASLLCRMLAHDPADRFSDWPELISGLEQALQGTSKRLKAVGLRGQPSNTGIRPPESSPAPPPVPDPAPPPPPPPPAPRSAPAVRHRESNPPTGNSNHILLVTLVIILVLVLIGLLYFVQSP